MADDPDDIYADLILPHEAFKSSQVNMQFLTPSSAVRASLPGLAPPARALHFWTLPSGYYCSDLGAFLKVYRDPLLPQHSDVRTTVQALTEAGVDNDGQASFQRPSKRARVDGADVTGKGSSGSGTSSSKSQATKQSRNASMLVTPANSVRTSRTDATRAFWTVVVVVVLRLDENIPQELVKPLRKRIDEFAEARKLDILEKALSQMRSDEVAATIWSPDGRQAMRSGAPCRFYHERKASWVKSNPAPKYEIADQTHLLGSYGKMANMLALQIMDVDDADPASSISQEASSKVEQLANALFWEMHGGNASGTSDLIARPIIGTLEEALLCKIRIALVEDKPRLSDHDVMGLLYVLKRFGLSISNPFVLDPKVQPYISKAMQDVLLQLVEQMWRVNAEYDVLISETIILVFRAKDAKNLAVSSIILRDPVAAFNPPHPSSNQGVDANGDEVRSCDAARWTVAKFKGTYKKIASSTEEKKTGASTKDKKTAASTEDKTTAASTEEETETWENLLAGIKDPNKFVGALEIFTALLLPATFPGIAFDHEKLKQTVQKIKDGKLKDGDTEADSKRAQSGAAGRAKTGETTRRGGRADSVRKKMANAHVEGTGTGLSEAEHSQTRPQTLERGTPWSPGDDTSATSPARLDLVEGEVETRRAGNLRKSRRSDRSHNCHSMAPWYTLPGMVFGLTNDRVDRTVSTTRSMASPRYKPLMRMFGARPLKAMLPSLGLHRSRDFAPIIPNSMRDESGAAFSPAEHGTRLKLRDNLVQTASRVLSSDAALELLSFVDRGRLAYVCRGSITSRRQSAPEHRHAQMRYRGSTRCDISVPVIVKILDVSYFHPSDPENGLNISPGSTDYPYGYGFTRAEALHAFQHEARLYCGPLVQASAKGAVPKFLGVWNQGPVWIMILEDCGDEMALKKSSNRHNVLSALDVIHECGVLHGDIARRHIVQHPVDRKPRIVDFDQARYYPAIARNTMEWVTVEAQERLAVTEMAAEVKDTAWTVVRRDDIKA